MCEWKYECLALNSTVKPVYNCQSQGITKMSFVWEHIYTVNAFEYVAVSALTVGHTTWPAKIPLSNTRIPIAGSTQT